MIGFSLRYGLWDPPGTFVTEKKRKKLPALLVADRWKLPLLEIIIDILRIRMRNLTVQSISI
jgi:hypothetical protein